jgi:hypothetical protein
VNGSNRASGQWDQFEAFDDVDCKVLYKLKRPSLRFEREVLVSAGRAADSIHAIGVKRKCGKAAAMIRPSGASLDDSDADAVKMRTIEVQRVLGGSVNLFTREKIQNVYDVAFIY